jgi:hypothetical protein
MPPSLTASTAYVRRISSARHWLRGLLKEWLHSATGTILSGIGTNGIEQLAPDSIAGVAVKAHLVGVGLSFQQCAAVFGVTLFVLALRRVNEATAPGNSVPPWGGSPA